MSLLPGKFYLDDFFEDFAPTSKLQNMFMKSDIYEKKGKIYVEMDIPGYDKEDIKIDVEDGILTVEATKEETEVEKDDEKNYFRKERTYGTFKRQFNIGNVNQDEINAKFNNGVLEISFPKEEQKETKKFIEIK